MYSLFEERGELKMKYYMRSKIVSWDSTKPSIIVGTKSYGFCEVFKSRADFGKVYPNETPFELEGDK